MFTGLVQSVGTVHLCSSGLLVDGLTDFPTIALGDSISVDGVCLTVAKLTANGFLADVSQETLSRTTLGEKAKGGGSVNLEPALRLADRLGGHLVSGHVDGLGEIKSIENIYNSWKLELSWENHLFGRYICEKASVAVDGISLTVAGCSQNGIVFWIAVIPHTWENTSLNTLKVGSKVNLEADLIAKYTENLLSFSQTQDLEKNNSQNQPLTKDWLSTHGWN